MRLKLDPPDTTSFDSASVQAGDHDLAQRLTQLIRNLEHGSVAIFNGRWGIGKTTFIKRWLSHLKNEGIPSVYVDAFAIDYLESPFVAIAGALSQAAEQANKADHPTYKAFVDAASKVGRTLGGAAAKIAVKAATFGVIGSAEVESLGDAKDAISDALGDCAETAVKELIQEHSKKEGELASLKAKLAKFPALLSDTENEEERIVVVIDELDRCRPDFALGMIESIKHFFGSDHVHFVLVTNRDHLVLSVIHKYGSFATAEEYLRKFYDYQILYEQEYTRDGAPQLTSFINRLANGLLGNIPERNEISGFMKAAAVAHRLTLRDLENVFSNLALAYAAIRSNEFRPAFVITMLALLKTIDSPLYASAKAGAVTCLEINERLFSGNQWGTFDTDRMRKVFQFYLDPNVEPNSDEWSGWGREMWNFNIERLRVIPYLCNSVIDRFALAEATA